MPSSVSDTGSLFNAHFSVTLDTMLPASATLGDTLLRAIQNPVVVVSMLVSLWTALTDPTTEGTGDSNQAMTYDRPKAA